MRLKSVPGKTRGEKINTGIHVKFDEENFTVKEAQHGFRNRWSCSTNPQKNYFHGIYGNLDNLTLIYVAYLRFQKAFHTVAHKHLSTKLSSQSSQSVHVVRDWLTRTKQRVFLNRHTSKWLSCHQCCNKKLLSWKYSFHNLSQLHGKLIKTIHIHICVPYQGGRQSSHRIR